jgi:hypothetical protein
MIEKQIECGLTHISEHTLKIMFFKVPRALSTAIQADRRYRDHNWGWGSRRSIGTPQYGHRTMCAWDLSWSTSRAPRRCAAQPQKTSRTTGPWKRGKQWKLRGLQSSRCEDYRSYPEASGPGWRRGPRGTLKLAPPVLPGGVSLRLAVAGSVHKDVL